MLSQLELEDLFERLGTPEAGRQLIRKARREAPVRKVQSHLDNVITRFVSRKMGRVIETESRTVEFPAAVRYERDPKIIEFIAQPVRLDVRLTGTDGKVSRTQHTPDFMLIREDGIWIEEWREEERLARLAAKHPSRFTRDALGWRFPQVEQQLADMGIGYRLRSAAEHPRQYIQNLLFLGDYLEPGVPSPSAPFLAAVEEQFRDRAAMHLRHLLDSDGISPDDVYKAIADGAITFDLFNDDLADTDRVLVFRDAVSMAFHRKVSCGESGLPAERRDFSITAGGTVSYGGTCYEIALVGKESLLLKSSGETVELAISLVMDLRREGKLEIGSPQGVREISTIPAEGFGTHSPKWLDVALQRAEWATGHLRTPTSAPRSERTIQRFRSAMRRAGDSCVEQHLALVPRYSSSGNRERKIPAAVIDLIEATVKARYNRPTNLTKRATYLYFVDACHSAGLVPCSERTFVKELDRHGSVGAREGKRRAYQERAIVWHLKLEERIHGARPFEIVHIDHTELQLVFTVPGSKRSLGRAWLSLAVDAESRAILGYYISFEAPSYRSCMMVIRDIVRRHGRMPETFVLDNGKEFHSRAMHRVCALYGTHLRYRPGGKPRVGSVMERLFGTTQSELINRLQGNTQVLRHARMATKSVMPENFVEWTLPALHGALDYYFSDLYGKEPHPAHGDGPAEHLRARMVETGERRNRMVTYDQLFRIETCPSPVDRDTRVVDRQRGVKINHIWYWHDALRDSSLHGKPVEIRIDPWDVRYVFALVNGNWCACRSKLVGLLRGYTEVEQRYAFAELAERHKIKRKDLTPERVAEWLRVLDPKNFDPRFAEQQSEARLVYEPLGMAQVCADSPDGEMGRGPAESRTTLPAEPRVKPRTVVAAHKAIVATPEQSEDEGAFDDDYDFL